MAVETSTDLAVFFNSADWGEEDATYTAPGGGAVTCDVVLFEGVKLIDGDSGELLGTGTTMAFRLDQVADPARDGTVLVGATTYVIQDVVERDRNICMVQVRKQ